MSNPWRGFKLKRFKRKENDFFLCAQNKMYKGFSIEKGKGSDA